MTWKRRHVLVLAALAMLCWVAVPAREGSAQGTGVRYLHYANARYGYSIDYPDFFAKGAPPTNNDGRVFTSRDGRSSLAVYGSNNVMNEGLRDAYGTLLREKGGAVGYKALGGNWFVVSWRESGKIFYQKVYHGPGSSNGFILSYPQSQRHRFDPIVARLAGSFRPGDLGTSH